MHTWQQGLASSQAQGLLVLTGMASCWIILYIPLYAEFSANAWLRPENGHAPLVLCFCFGAIAVKLWHLKNTPAQFISNRQEVIAGTMMLLAGLALYVFGRVEQVELASSASQAPVAAGMLLLLGGVNLVKRLWFPALMLAYLIIWPGWIINHYTAPLKLWISGRAADLLVLFDLPVAQAGVTLVIGPYRLLVADACAGLNSLISLTSLTAIYLYVLKPKNIWHGATLFLATIPIAICTNFFRIILLILITYYFGYDAGQGFLHDFAGLFMFTLALVFLFVLDSLLPTVAVMCSKLRNSPA